MKYYMHIDGRQLGPLEERDLIAHGLQRSTLVWCKTMPNWAPAYHVPALMRLLYPSAQQPQRAQAQPAVAAARRQQPRRQVARNGAAARPAFQPQPQRVARPQAPVAAARPRVAHVQPQYMPQPQQHKPKMWHRPASDTSLTYKQAFASAMRHYFDFKGRSRRSEYWKFFAIVLLLNLVTAIIDWNLGLTIKHHGITGTVVSLVLLVPFVSAGVRRLHDMGQSGLKLLWGLLPVVGWVMVLNWHCQDSQKKENRWGRSPKYYRRAS